MQPVVIHMTHKELKISPFKLSQNELTVGKEWLNCLEDLEEQFRYFKITEVVDQKDAIKIYGGDKVKSLAKNLIDPTAKPEYALAGEELNDYTRIKWKLTDYFTKKTNYHLSKYLFNKMRPQLKKPGKPGSGLESTMSYATKLREAASYTDFPNKK